MKNCSFICVYTEFDNEIVIQKHNYFSGNDQLKDSLVGAEIVVIPAGVPRKPGMTRDDLFNTNASIVAGIAQVRHNFRYNFNENRQLQIIITNVPVQNIH